MTFAEFLKIKRQEKGINLRTFANMLEIAPSYLSDIEKEKRNAPTQEILEKIAILLNLDDNDRNTLYDLAAKSKNEVAMDITKYVTDNKNVRVALRTASEMKLGDEEWLNIIEEMLKTEK